MPASSNHSLPSLEDHCDDTPEAAFHRYQRKLDDHRCQVCCDSAAGFHHGAYVCEACKKFFMRHAHASANTAAGEQIQSDKRVVSACPFGGQCVIRKSKRNKCQHCRLMKCLSVGMRIKGDYLSKEFDVSKIPCRVCGNNSSGFHFGALTCEGCKGFFRRTDKPNVEILCRAEGKCEVRAGDRNACKGCRYRKCLEVGMSRQGSRIGRQPNSVKYHCVKEIQSRLASPTPNSLSNNNNNTHLASSSSTASMSSSMSQNVPNSVPPPAAPIPLDFDSLLRGLQLSAAYLCHSKPAVKVNYETQGLVAFAEGGIEMVWNQMMKQFIMHTHHIICFAKSVVGFTLLDISARRKLVRSSMYSIMLLELSRDYNLAADEYNYFDFTRQERDIILQYFPSFQRITRHLRLSGLILKPLELDKEELTLLCILEMFKNYNAVPECFIVKQLYDCYRDLLENHIASKSAEEQQRRRKAFCEISEVLDRMNREHHDVISQLRLSRSHLSFPELYVDMFRLAGQDNVFSSF